MRQIIRAYVATGVFQDAIRSIDCKQHGASMLALDHGLLIDRKGRQIVVPWPNVSWYEVTEEHVPATVEKVAPSKSKVA